MDALLFMARLPAAAWVQESETSYIRCTKLLRGAFCSLPQIPRPCLLIGDIPRLLS